MTVSSLSKHDIRLQSMFQPFEHGQMLVSVVDRIIVAFFAVVAVCSNEFSAELIFLFGVFIATFGCLLAMYY